MNIGVVNPIQLFASKKTPGMRKTVHDAYNGCRQHLKMPFVTRVLEEYARATAITEIIKNGIPRTIRKIPMMTNTRYETIPI